MDNCYLNIVFVFLLLQLVPTGTRAASTTNGTLQNLPFTRGDLTYLPAEKALLRQMGPSLPTEIRSLIAQPEDLSTNRVIRGGFLSEILRDHKLGGQIDQLRIVNSQIQGDLDASFLSLPFPISFEGCEFTGSLNLSNARIHSFAGLNTRFHDLNATGTHVDSFFYLASCKVDKIVSLTNAKFESSVSFDGTSFMNEDNFGVIASSAHIVGSLFLRRTRGPGGIQLALATIGGCVDLSESQLCVTNRSAIDADRCEIGRGLIANKANLTGLVSFQNARIGHGIESSHSNWELFAMGVTLEGPCLLQWNQFKGALNFASSRIKGDFVVGACKCEQVILQRSFIDGSINFTQSHCVFKKGTALDLASCHIQGDLGLHGGFVCEGLADLSGTTTGGNWFCEGASFANPNSKALNAAQAIVAGSVNLKSGFRSTGKLAFDSAQIGADFEIEHCELENSGRDAIATEGATVKGRMHIVQSKINGSLFLKHLSVARELEMRRVQILGPQAKVLADFSKIGGPIRLGQCIFDGDININESNVGKELQVFETRFRATNTVNLQANGIRIGSSVIITRTDFNGSLQLRSAEINGNVELSEIHVGTLNGTSLDCSTLGAEGSLCLSNMVLRGSFTADDAKIAKNLIISRGAVEAISLENAHIGAHLRLSQVRLKTAISLAYAEFIKGLHLSDCNEEPNTRYDLRNCVTDVLDDENFDWNRVREFQLEGFRYAHLENSEQFNLLERMAWIKRGSLRGFSAQPYEQLASVLKASGYEQASKNVLLEKNRQRARTLEWKVESSNINDLLWYKGFGRIVGWGYTPIMAFFVWLFLVAIGYTVFSRGYNVYAINLATTPATLRDPKNERVGAMNFISTASTVGDSENDFDALLFSLEAGLPLVKFTGQTTLWKVEALPKVDKGRRGPKKGKTLAKACVSYLLRLPLASWIKRSKRSLLLMKTVKKLLLIGHRFFLRLADSLANMCEHGSKCYLYYYYFHVISGWLLAAISLAAVSGFAKT